MKIQSVGIKDIQIPVRIREKNGGLQNSVATVSLQASMPGEYRESCVITFTSVLNKYMDELSVTNFPDLLAEVKEGLRAESARVEMSFPYFIEKKAPVTKTRSLMEYECSFTGEVGTDSDFILSVKVPITTLCPCSKEISDAGAHNQRAEVTLNVKFKKFIWVEELIRLIEDSASCELWALLKRPDEKHVTERAYENPMFVEDVVRKIAVSALDDTKITWFSASVESFESIHKHSAYAYVDSSEIR
ncbi:MAG TPA: GTP cyclohydrolase I FolE2 [Desulfocapsa sulfexigens]|nr:GTP cyclohydrolase I FolE2 [Desulfocapsa sulfexigens]